VASYKVKDFIDKIPGTGGIVSALADRVGCHWHTARKWIDEHPTIKAAWEAERNKVTDRARHNIVKAIQKGDLQMSKWWLTVMDEQFVPREKHELSYDLDEWKKREAAQRQQWDDAHPVIDEGDD